MSVLYRRVLGSENDIFSVKSGGHLQKRQTISDILHCDGILQNTIYRTYLRSQVPLDKVLISLHLDRTVTADGLVMIARNRIIECVHTYIKHAIVKLRILKYDFIHRTRLVYRSEVARRNEMTLVEISLSYRSQVEIYKKYHGDGHNDHSSLPYERTFLAHSIILRRAVCPQDKSAYDCDEPE